MPCLKGKKMLLIPATIWQYQYTLYFANTVAAEESSQPGTNTTNIFYYKTIFFTRYRYNI